MPVPKLRSVRRRNWRDYPLPSMPKFPVADEDTFSGVVQGQPASEPEERLARALDQRKMQYIFRYTLGAPRGMPGWKELDFLVSSNGLLYPIEVDTAFTHRNKKLKDILHDTLILQDPALNQMGQLYPEVLHADGDHELATEKGAGSFVDNRIGR